jgi:hypothetical protein
MSLATQISSLASRIATEIKAVRTELASGLSGKASTSHTHALSSLSGTAISTPSSGQVLTYDGTSWANASPSAPNMATGTSFPSGPAAGQQFFRTDVKIAYIYNGSAWDELSRPNSIEPLLLIGI